MPRDEYDDDRPRRRPRDEYDDDRPRRRSRRDADDYDRRPRSKQVSILGIFSLVKGIGALIVSFFPCVGAIAILPALLGLVLGLIGLIVARKSNGRQGTGLPIAGMCVSGAAIAISLIWIAFMGAMTGGAAVVSEQEAADVRAAGPDVPAVTAVQLDKDFDANELKAETDYKGKVIQVTGAIKAIVRDRPGIVVVELRGTPDSTIDCEFRREDEGQLAGRNVGDQVTVRGLCRGRRRGWVTLASCVVVANPAPPKEAPAIAPGAVLRVTAVEFAREYEDDEVRADRKYKGKQVEVTGVIDGFDLDDPDVLVVQFKGIKRGFKDVTVDCEFAPTREVKAKAGRLKPGDTVTIRGTCTGHTTLENCQLVEAGAGPRK